MSYISNLWKEFWSYLGETQSNGIRAIHALLACLIIYQIIDSNFMVVEYLPHRFLGWGTWIHIISGITITIIALTFITVVLKKRGFKHFFPYMYGEFTQLKKDFKVLLSFKLPEAQTYGLATIVQGLGLGALILVFCSGLFWFVCWLLQLSIAEDVQEIHAFLTGFIEAYIIGHGALGIVHFLVRKYLPQFIFHPKI